MKLLTDSTISISCKLHKAEQFHNKKLKTKIKNYFSLYRNNKRKLIQKAITFRKTCLIVKIFKFFNSFTKQSIESSRNLVKNFRIFFLKWKSFSMMKQMRLINYRENKILHRMKVMFRVRNRKLIQNAIDSWKKFYICQKFRKVKDMQKLVQIFYHWKLLSNYSKY
jgi:hypothetical protein